MTLPDDNNDDMSSPYYSSVPDYMAENFSKAQLDEFKEAFALFDATSSGSVPVQDIGTVVRSLGGFEKTGLIFFSFVLQFLRLKLT